MQTKKRTFIFRLGISLAIATTLLATSIAQASGGTLDTTFGGSGIVQFTYPLNSVNDMATQSNDKIIVVGGYWDFEIARYNSDGSLDTTFGTNSSGMVDTNISNRYDHGYAVAIQPDGKIIMAGSSQDNNIERTYFSLARYNSDGSLDTTFDNDGTLITNLGTNSEANDVVIQADNKIVVVGSSDAHLALARYNSDGALDAGFGVNGKVITTIAANNTGNSVVIQSDGKIVVGGESFENGASYFVLARFNIDGTLDTGYGTGGKITTDFGGNDSQGNSIAIQSDDKIVLAGNMSINFSRDFALARYDINGLLDTTFGTNGKSTTDFNSDDISTAIVLQSDEKIILAGSSGNDYRRFALARYNSNGSLDETFGANGKAIAGSANTYSYINAISIQADGKIVTAGSSLARFYNGTNYTISGNAGTNGVALSYDNGGIKTVTSDDVGDYSFNLPAGWTGAITPTKDNYAFSPSSKTYTDLQENQPAQNYLAINYTITGNVGVGGATLAYENNGAKIATADSAGNYSIAVRPGWNGTITPSKANYIFSPLYRLYSNVQSNKATQEGYSATSTAFNKLTPTNEAVDQPVTLTLSWSPSTGATKYQYCYRPYFFYDTCYGWKDNGLSTNVTISGLENSTTYYWTVRSINSGGTTYSNEDIAAIWSFKTSHPIKLSGNSIKENLPKGTNIGAISALNNNNSESFVLQRFDTSCNGTDNNLFRIVGTQLQTDSIFDFEEKSSYKICIGTSPHSVDINNATLEELDNLPGIESAMAQSIINYRDLHGIFYTNYDVTNVPGIGITIFNAIDNLIRTEYEGGDYIDTAFTITIIDGNDSPTNITISNSRIAENKPVNTVIGKLTSSDPEVNDYFTYSLCDTPSNEFFTIVGSTLRIKSPLDYEKQKIHSVCVQSTDLHGLTFEKSLTIRVLDVRDEIPPQTSAKYYPRKIGSVAYYVFTFTSSEANSRFMCKLDTGTYFSCTNSRSYTRLPIGQHIFYVYATDLSGNPDQTPATINFTVK